MATTINPLTGTGTFEWTDNPAGTAAEQNLSNIPNLEKVSSLVNAINQQAQMARAPGGEVAWTQLGANVQRNAAGLLPEDFLTNLRTGLAERGGAAGMGVDTPALNAAALRAMGIQSNALQEQAVRDYATLSSTLPPLYSVEHGLTTPALAANVQEAGAQNALAIARINQQAQQFAQQMLANQQAAALRGAGGRGTTLGSDMNPNYTFPTGGGGGGYSLSPQEIADVLGYGGPVPSGISSSIDPATGLTPLYPEGDINSELANLVYESPMYGND